MTLRHECSPVNLLHIFNFIEIALLHGCSPVNMLHIFRTPFPKNTSGRLLLDSTKMIEAMFGLKANALFGLKP